MKTKRIPATALTRLNEPSKSNCPSKSNFGVSKTLSGIRGTFKPQPFGFTFPVAPSKFGPIFRLVSMMTAKIVETIMPINNAPLTLRIIKPMIKISPNTKTIIGQPTRFPPSPSCTGTGPAPVLRTKPESTKPIKAMNNPIPTEIAIFNCEGTALKTAVLNPVKTKTVMMIPSRTTRPIASCHDIFEAIPTATKVFSPRPVASANGKLATTPIKMDITPAIKAVAAATNARLGASPPPRYFPSPSFARPMISGFSATM